MTVVRRLVVISTLVSSLVLGACARHDGIDVGGISTVATTSTSTSTSTTVSSPPVSRPPPTVTVTTLAPTTTPTAPPPVTKPRTTVPPTTAARPGPAIVVARGSGARRVVALTFDAGSDTGHTAAILDRLAAEGIKASFGVTGRWVDANPGLTARIAREGHQLVNHTYDHKSFTGYSTGTAPLTRAQRFDQISRAETAIRSAAGVGTSGWFRPPYGDIDASVLADVGAAGYRYVAMWTVDSLGWKGITAAEITDRCLDRAVPGAIYLFHVGEASADVDALPAIIAGLRADGYGFVRLAAFV